MPITKTQSVTGNGATLVLNGVAATALLTLQSSWFRTPATTVAEAKPTDTQGTWSVGVSPTPGSLTGAPGEVGSAIFYQENVAAGTHTITPATETTPRRTFVEWAGAATVTPADQSTSGTTANSAHTSRTTGTTGTTTQADEMVLIACAVAAAGGSATLGNAGTTFGTPPVGTFSDLQTVNNDASDIATQHEWKTVAATGTQTATFTWTASEATMTSQATICTFLAAVSSSDSTGASVAARPGGSMGPRMRRAMPQVYADTPVTPVELTQTPAAPIPAISLGPRRRRSIPQQYADTPAIPVELTQSPAAPFRPGRGPGMGPMLLRRNLQRFANMVPAAAATGVTYPQLERHHRGEFRGENG